ncbi:MAG: epoxide hydrolase family protein, partial [Acidimicrobiia bacterium]
MIEPFRVRVPDSALADLHRRLAETRLVSPAAGEPWESGVDYQYLAHLVEYWGGQFDWRRQEEWLNSFDQYMAKLGDQEVHFVHVRADRNRYPDVIPIVLSHGWPYSFVEFLSIVGWLTDPLPRGGTPADAFDVVVPSLPGYGYSSPLVDDPFTGDVVARLCHTLMTEVLGYDRYATYGDVVGS